MWRLVAIHHWDPMRAEADNSGVIIRPPIALALAFVMGLAIDQLLPLRFVPARVSAPWIGSILFAIGFALTIWATATMRKAGTQIRTSQPTTAIVKSGPYRFTRNPIYFGMFLGLIGLAIGFDSLWILAMFVPFFLTIRYGVVAREEAYLERKFGEDYLSYKADVRRWL